VKATVFLGGGRITAALITGLRLAGDKTPIVVHDRNPHKLRALNREHGVKVEPDLGRALAQAELLIVAVRPDSVVALLEKTRQAASLPTRAKRPVLACSLAAGIPLAKLRGALGPPVRWARAMPSPVARSGRGLTALTFERGVPAAARKRLKDFFAQVGAVLEVPESQFDAFTAAYSCSHGYYALAGLAQAAQKLGLDRETAFSAAAHALADGILGHGDADDGSSRPSADRRTRAARRSGAREKQRPPLAGRARGKESCGQTKEPDHAIQREQRSRQSHYRPLSEAGRDG
jgi:pyrroline-5-carboxylate reductase